MLIINYNIKIEKIPASALLLVLNNADAGTDTDTNRYTTNKSNIN